MFSDGKLNFTPRLGKTDIGEFLNMEEAEKLIGEIEQIFSSFGMDGETFPTNMKAEEEYRIKARKAGLDLQIIRQKHLGSDKLPEYIQKMEKYLKEEGVDFGFECEAINILVKEEKLAGLKTDKGEIKTDKLLVAPGRSGNSWLSQEFDRLGIEMEQRPIEIGVRVETSADVLKDMCSVIYDPTFYFHAPSYDDKLRTFCTNRNGYVAEENIKNSSALTGTHTVNNYRITLILPYLTECH